MDRVNALGVPHGAGLSELKAGRSIVTPPSAETSGIGRIVSPEMVLSGVKPGRKIIVMGTCSGCASLERQVGVSHHRFLFLSQSKLVN